MAIYVGMTQDLGSARKFLLAKKKGMYPDVEMGPFKRKIDALNYIKFMQAKFPGALEINLPDFPIEHDQAGKWWVFSFEHSGEVH